jgi:hypothetical protein
MSVPSNDKQLAETAQTKTNADVAASAAVSSTAVGVGAVARATGAAAVVTTNFMADEAFHKCCHDIETALNFHCVLDDTQIIKHAQAPNSDVVVYIFEICSSQYNAQDPKSRKMLPAVITKRYWLEVQKSSDMLKPQPKITVYDCHYYANDTLMNFAGDIERLLPNDLFLPSLEERNSNKGMIFKLKAKDKQAFKAPLTFSNIATAVTETEVGANSINTAIGINHSSFGVTETTKDGTVVTRPGTDSDLDRIIEENTCKMQ